MARHVSHRHRGVDGWLAEKVQTQLGILGVPVKQRAVDRVGLAGPRLRTHRPPALPCVYKHPRRIEEHRPQLIARLPDVLAGLVDVSHLDADAHLRNAIHKRKSNVKGD